MLAFLRGEHAEPLTVAAHVERRGGHLAVQRVVLRDPKMREPIGPAVWALDRRGLARPQAGFGLGLERHAGEGDKQHDHARVYDVAAVAPAGAGGQPAERQRIALPLLAVAGGGPPGGAPPPRSPPATPPARPPRGGEKG